MKSIIYCALLTFVIYSSSAQSISITTSQLQKTSKLSPSIPVIINAQIIGKDSVIIPFDKNYWVVPDSCAVIIRYGHYDRDKKKFIGKFKDVTSYDLTKVVAEGSYSNNGLKEGPFTIYYMNGNVQYKGEFSSDKFSGEWKLYYFDGTLKAKGSFKDGKYIGEWNFYFNDGNPELSFNADNDILIIKNAWKDPATKMVDKGIGYYQTNADLSSTAWMGKIVNGLPDSTWTLQTQLGGDQTTVIENFQNNVFTDGVSRFGNSTFKYSNESHISLFPKMPSFFVIDKAHYLNIAPICGSKTEPMVYAKMWDKTYLIKNIPTDGIKVN